MKIKLKIGAALAAISWGVLLGGCKKPQISEAQQAENMLKQRELLIQVMESYENPQMGKVVSIERNGNEITIRGTNGTIKMLPPRQ